MKKWLETKVPRRLLSLAVCAAMVFSLLPVFAFAEEGNDGLCQHHTEHTPECGYVEAVAGQDCTHVCGDECFLLTTACTHVHEAACYSDGVLPAEGEEKTADACAHACTEESGCVTKTPACVHTAHDETCGYVEAVAGQPCGFVCEECAGEESKPTEPTEAQPEEKVITDWEWVDEWEIIDPDSGKVLLPFASAERIAWFDDIVSLLPTAITADSEELTLGQWTCEAYPVETGAYEGAYIFQTTLPEGFVLPEGGNVLNLTVVLGDPEGEPVAMMAISMTEPHTGTHTLNGISYDNVYELSEAGHLYWFANQVNSGNTAINAIVIDNITVNQNVLKSDGTLSDNSGSFESWTPIGNASAQYSGTFAGNGYTISGLYVNAESTSGIGLFGSIDSGGTVVNVKIADFYFAGKSTVGGVCGYNSGTVSNCYSSGTVTGTGTHIGGVCGMNDSIVSNSTNSGTVTGTGTHTGGVCGFNFSTVSSCTNSGKVNGNFRTGGICGTNSGTVSNSTNSGTVTGSSNYVGGVCGYNGSMVSNCTNSGTVTGSSSYVGGVCGHNYNGTVSNCYFDSTAYAGNAIGYNNSGTVTDVCGKSPAEFASGEVAYLLNGSTSEGTLVWYQNIDQANVTRDSYPQFTGATVYKTSESSPCQGYTNNPSREREHALQNHACIYCGYWEPVSVTVSGIAAKNKVYDGGVTAQLDFTHAQLAGVLSAYSDVTVSATGTFANADVEQDKTVTIDSLTLEGEDASRYYLADSGQQTSATASISAKPVTIQGAAVAATKVYDGSTTAQITSNGTLSDNYDGSNLTIVPGSAAYDTKDVGENKTVAFSGFSLGGSAAGNYTLTAQPASTTASITAKPVNATVTVTPKPYDGTTNATVSAEVTEGLISGDTMTITGLTGTFDDANAGTDKTVTVNTNNMSITGTGATNYDVTIPASATGTITKAQAVITVEAGKNTYSKAYGDAPFQLEGITENSNDADVRYAVTSGTDVVSVSESGMVTILKAGEAIITLSLPESANYLEAQSVGIYINVAKAASSVTITGDPSKTYDGQPAILNQDMYTVNGGAGRVAYKLRDADDSTYTMSVPKNAGDYTVRVTAVEDDNHTAASATKDFTIRPQDITVTITPNGGTYGNVTPATAELNGVVSGETVPVTLTYSGTAYDNTVVSGTATPTQAGTYTVTASISDSNYRLTGVATAEFVIDKATVTTPAVASKVYNGSVQTADISDTDRYTVTANNGGTDTGSYTVELSLTDSDNYKWDTAGGVTAFQITKADSNSWTTEPAISGWTYGDTSSTPAGAAQFGTVKVEYTSDSITYSETAPTKAGDYKARFTVAETNNFVGLSAEKTFTIAKREVTLNITIRDKTFDDSTTAEIDTVNTNDFVSGDDVRVVNGTPSFTRKTPGEHIPVSFTDFTLEGGAAGNYQLAQPTGVTGRILPTGNYLDLTNNPDFAGHTEVWVDGVRYPIQTEDGRYVNLSEEGGLLTIYTYQQGSAHEKYPTGMAVYRIDRQASGAAVAKIDALDDLLQYSGCSIRVTGNRGIRMITSLTKGNKSALTGAGLAGYTLEEYGTVVQWADTLGDQSLTLATGKHNYAYKKGVADPVFATSGDLTQYTNVLVWDSLTDAQLGKDIVMRPYIILRDGSGNTVTLYGGCVSRSIGYIAYQNRAVFNPGTAAYKYVWDILHAVYGDQYDSEYKG